METSNQSRAAIELKCTEVAREQEVAQTALWGKRQELALTMLSQKLEMLAVELSRIPSPQELQDREKVTMALLEGSVACAHLEDKEKNRAEAQLQFMLKEQPPSLPLSTRLCAIINICKVEGAGNEAGTVAYLAEEQLRRMEMTAGAGFNPIAVAVRHDVLSVSLSQLLPKGGEAPLAPPTMVLPIVLQGAELDLIDSNLRDITKEIVEGSPTQSRRDMLCSCAVEMLHAGGDPASDPTDSSPSALSLAIAAEDQGLIALLVEHANGAKQQHALDALVDTLAGAPSPGVNSPGPSPAGKAAFHEIARSKMAGESIAHLGNHGYQLLKRACDEGDAALVVEMMEQGVEGKGHVGLVQAILRTTDEHQVDLQIKVVKALVEGGVDLDAPDENGLIPLEAALDAENLETLRVLLNSGAKASSEPSMLHATLKKMLTAARGSYEWDFLNSAIDILIEAGAAANVVGPDGYFPLDLALVVGEIGIVWLIKLAGADPAESFPLHALLSELVCMGDPATFSNAVVTSQDKHDHGRNWGRTYGRKTAAREGWNNLKLAGRNKFDRTDSFPEIMEVDIERLEVITIKAALVLVGKRPCVEVGQCDLRSWQAQTEDMLRDALAADGELAIEFMLKPARSPASASSGVKIVLEQVVREQGDMPTPVYQGVWKNGSVIPAVVGRLVNERDEYLRRAAMQLIHEGSGVGRPAHSDATPLSLATIAGEREIANALVKDTGGQMSFDDVMHLIDLLPSSSASGDPDRTALVMDLIADVVGAAKMSEEEQEQLLDMAVKAGMSGVVSSLLEKGTDPNGGPYLHDAIGSMQQNTHLDYWPVIRALLEAGADPNNAVQGECPLDVVLKGHVSVGQLDVASELVKHGAVFPPGAFGHLLTEWDGEVDPQRSNALEQTIAEMCRRTPDYNVEVNGKDVIEIAVEKKSPLLLQIIFESEKKAIIAKEPHTAKLVPAFTDLLKGVVASMPGAAGTVPGGLTMTASTLDATTGADGEDSEDKQAIFAVELLSVLSMCGEPVFVDMVKTMPANIHTLFNAVKAHPEAAEHGINFNGVDAETGFTVLHTAADENDGELIAQFLEIGMVQEPPIDLEVKNKDGLTALELAAKTNKMEALSALVLGGADVPAEVLYPAFLVGDEKMALALVAAGGSGLLNVKGPMGRSCLHACAMRNDTAGEELVRKMIAAGADVDVTDLNGSTPLMLAVESGNKSVVRVLLEQGANPLVTNHTGVSSVSLAVKLTGEGVAGAGAIKAQLLPKCQLGGLKADPGLFDAALKAADFALLDQISPTDPTATLPTMHGMWPVLWWAGFMQQPDGVTHLLKSDPKAAKYTSNTGNSDEIGGRNILHWLAEWNGKGVGVCIPALVRAGASLTQEDEEKETPLNVACRCGNAEVAHALLQAGAGLKSDAYDEIADSAKKATDAGYSGIADMVRDSAAVSQPDASKWASQVGSTAAYIDPDFQPCAASLSKTETLPETYAKVSWKRAGEICEGDSVYPSGSIASAGPYTCGQLGTPWWWIVRECSEESALRGLIREGSKSHDGMYHVTLTQGGESKEVTIDDYIPCVLRNGLASVDPAFGSKGACGLWSLLICKAAAKCAGSYRALFALDTEGVSADTKGVMAQLGGENTPSYEMEATASVVALGSLLHDSPLASSVGGENSGDISIAVARALADVKVDSGAGGESSQKVLAEQRVLPKFKVNFAADTEDVEVIFGGNVPEDLRVKVTDGRSTVVYEKPLDVHTGTVMLKMEAQRQPYFVLLASGMNPRGLPEFDIDFDTASGGELTVEHI